APFALLRYDLANCHAGEVLTVADSALVLLLALELEDEVLGSAAVGFDGAAHAGSLDGRTGLYGVTIHDGEHLVEFDGRADVAGQRFHLNRFARGDAI